jgi:hypothetical protein
MDTDTAQKSEPLLQDMIDERLAFVEPLEERIGIPKGTMGPLLREESDWAFIVKLAVILEASLIEVLVAHLGNESMRTHIRGLQMQGRTGRIPLAVSVGALSEEDAATMAAIADVRNSFAHSTQNIGGSLSAFAKGLSLHEKQQLFKKLFGTSDEAAKNALDPMQSKSDWLPDSMRFVLWLAGGQVLAGLAMRTNKAEKERDEQRLKALQAKAFEALENHPGAFALSDLFKKAQG